MHSKDLNDGPHSLRKFYSGMELGINHQFLEIDEEDMKC
jgi:hypothetical protein